MTQLGFEKIHRDFRFNLSQCSFDQLDLTLLILYALLWNNKSRTLFMLISDKNSEFGIIHTTSFEKISVIPCRLIEVKHSLIQKLERSENLILFPNDCVTHRVLLDT